VYKFQTNTTNSTSPEIPVVHSANEWEMYKKILSMSAQQNVGGLNKAENASSTITLKDLKASTTSPHSQSPSTTIHQIVANNDNSSDVDINDENAPSNFENSIVITNHNDKVLYENPYDRQTSIHILPTNAHPPHYQHHHHHHHSTASHVAAAIAKLDNDMETDFDLQHAYPTSLHKSIHHATTISSTSTHYRADMIVDENLENKQQNFVHEEDDVWRPW
jgi:hypothetical protein